jgi:hypothetical protein
MHRRQPRTQVGAIAMPAELQVLHYQPGRLIVIAPAHRLWHTQGAAVQQLLQTARLGLEHGQLTRTVKLDEITLIAVLHAHGLVDATATDRALLTELFLFSGGNADIPGDIFPK